MPPRQKSQLGRSAEKLRARSHRDEPCPQTALIRNLARSRAGLFAHEYRSARATSATRVDAPRSTPRLPPFGRHGAPQRPGPRRGSPPRRRAGAALFRGRDRDPRPPGAFGCASPLPQPGGERAVRPVAPGVLAGQPRALRRRGRVDRSQRHAHRRHRRRGPVLGVARRRAQGRPRAGATGGVQQRTGKMRHRRRGVRRTDPALL